MNSQVQQSLRTINRTDDMRATIERAKAKGLIRGPGDKAPVDVGAGVALDGVSVRFVNITPAMARAWLNNNKNNRKLRATTVEAYARDMRSGAWLLTHQGVAFNDRDELLDGQHRLAAIDISGVTVTMLVITGLPSAGKPATNIAKMSSACTMDAVDRGAARSINDILELQHGMVKPRIATMTASAVARICLNGHKAKVTVPSVLAILETFKPGIAFAVTNAPVTIGLRQAVVLGCVALAFGVKPKETAAFFEKLVTGDSLDRKHPVLHLRNWLLSNAGGNIGSSPKEYLAAAGIIAHHLQAFIDGREMDHLAANAKGSLDYFKSQQAPQVEKIVQLFTLP